MDANQIAALIPSMKVGIRVLRDKGYIVASYKKYEKIDLVNIINGSLLLGVMEPREMEYQTPNIISKHYLTLREA